MVLYFLIKINIYKHIYDIKIYDNENKLITYECNDSVFMYPPTTFTNLPVKESKISYDDVEFLIGLFIKNDKISISNKYQAYFYNVDDKVDGKSRQVNFSVKIIG